MAIMKPVSDVMDYNFQKTEVKKKIEGGATAGFTVS